MSNKEKKIKQISILHNATILEALKKMDETYKRLLLVFQNNIFLNVLSIGDIQRAIIRNQSLNTPIFEILRKETRVAKVGESFEYIKAQMLKFKAECMPVIDENNQLIDIHFWDEIFSVDDKRISRNLNIPVVIMAGGKGTRLKPITNVLPKPLIPIGEKAIVEMIMDKFTQVGCHDFFLSVNYKSEMIKHYFEHLNNLNYNIKYLLENKPLGTAGSLYLLKGKVAQSFFVSNCDILIEEDYGEIYDYHKQNKNDFTIVTVLKNYAIPYGTIETAEDGLLKSLSEKPELTIKINSGMYLLESHVLKQIPDDVFYHITDLIECLKTKGFKVGVFPVSEGSWKDIGDWNEYLKQININT